MVFNLKLFPPSGTYEKNKIKKIIQIHPNERKRSKTFVMGFD